MSKKYKHIVVFQEDYDKLMSEGVELFLYDNPKFKGIHLTNVFMFKRAVEYFCKR